MSPSCRWSPPTTRPRSPSPRELIQAKVKSKNAFSGRDALRQLQFATLSLSVFGDGYAKSDSKSTFAPDLIREINPAVLDHVVYSTEQKFHCNFGHLIGYAADVLRLHVERRVRPGCL